MLARAIRKVLDSPLWMHYPEATYGGAIVKRFLSAASIGFVLICSSLVVTSFAQTAADAPASKEDVQKYLNAVHSHEMMKQMVEAMAKPMHQMAHEQCAKDKDKLPADCEARMNRIMDDMMNQMPFDEMLDAMIPAYEKHFTKGDMDTLTAFYSAPTGQKILRELPAIMSEGMESMMPIMRRSIDHMTENVQQQVAQMMKDSTKGTGSSAPTSKN
jgi:hypothetical protein